MAYQQDIADPRAIGWGEQLARHTARLIEQQERAGTSSDDAWTAAMLTLVATLLESVKVAPFTWESVRYALVADIPPDALARQAKQWAERAREAFGPAIQSGD